jgi:glutathione S-transferase
MIEFDTASTPNGHEAFCTLEELGLAYAVKAIGHGCGDQKSESFLKIHPSDVYPQYYSLADIANWCWVRTYKWSGVSRVGLPHLDRWLSAIKARTGLRKGVQVPGAVDSILEDKNAQEKFTDKTGTIL